LPGGERALQTANALIPGNCQIVCLDARAKIDALKTVFNNQAECEDKPNLLQSRPPTEVAFCLRARACGWADSECQIHSTSRRLPKIPLRKYMSYG